MRVLIARPREDAERTADMLRVRGHEPTVSPLMEIRFLDGPDISLQGIQAILATSANGVRALARRTRRRDVPVFAVGAQTSAAAEAGGFLNVNSADADSRALSQSILKQRRPAEGALLHAAGREHGADFARVLRGHGFEIKVEVLYEAVDTGGLSPEAAAQLNSKELDAVLLFSPRSARLFVLRLQQAGLADAAAGLIAVCISAVTAHALRPLVFSEVRVATQPNQQAMFELLNR